MGSLGKTFNCCQDREPSPEDSFRRRCGCLKTSDKLKEVLKQFPPPPPPSPRAPPPQKLKSTCISAFCNHTHTYKADSLGKSCPATCVNKSHGDSCDDGDLVKPQSQPNGVVWRVVSELVQLLQFSVTVIALAIYYLIYCYMQLLYYTVRSAIYFHNADRAMKVSIAVVTATSLFVGFHLLVRIERLIGLAED